MLICLHMYRFVLALSLLSFSTSFVRAQGQTVAAPTYTVLSREWATQRALTLADSIIKEFIKPEIYALRVKASPDGSRSRIKLTVRDKIRVNEKKRIDPKRGLYRTSRVAEYVNTTEQMDFVNSARNVTVNWRVWLNLKVVAGKIVKFQCLTGHGTQIAMINENVWVERTQTSERQFVLK